MNKVPFSKLNVKINESDCSCYYCDGEDDVFYEVKQYLPLNEKVSLVERVVNQSIDDNNFFNPMKVKMYMVLEVMFAYTNLEFEQELLDDPMRLYDLVVSTGIFTDVVNNIREKDWSEIKENVWCVIDNIYKYRNSARGILEDIKTDYSDLEFNAEKIREDLGNPENLEFLREVLTKLG